MAKHIKLRAQTNYLLFLFYYVFPFHIFSILTETIVLSRVLSKPLFLSSVQGLSPTHWSGGQQPWHFQGQAARVHPTDLYVVADPVLFLMALGELDF